MTVPTMTSTVVFVHGRSQESPDDVARDASRLSAYVAAKRRGWLGGLAKGLLAAGRPPMDESRVIFPFYGNALAGAIRDFEAAGGRRPELEILAQDADEQRAVLETKAAILLDAARALSFDTTRELGYTDPGAGAELAARPPSDGLKLDWRDALRVPVLRAALQFVSRKTGAPTTVIERFLSDVAYYLEAKDMRDLVLDTVKKDLRAQLPNGGDVVVVGHSLGSIVAYDLLTVLDARYNVRLLVTAGSPLGYPIVQRNLLGVRDGRRPDVPAALPRLAHVWVNAYDVLDFVALIHPLTGTFAENTPGQIDDQRTFNPTGPHDIADYLADPDIAAPISDALR